ncbi:STI1, partial [Symbiodinium sp. CCMP2456]
HLEAAPMPGGYRCSAKGSAAKPDSSPATGASGPVLKEIGILCRCHAYMCMDIYSMSQLYRLGRLQKFDVHAERWEVEVRGDGGGTKRLKEANLTAFVPPVVAPGLTVAELKERGNECFKASQLEEAIAFYSAALETAEKVLFNNRAQCFIMLCREIHGEDAAIGQEARRYAMRANMDAAKAIELDPTNGKAYYRRGCAVLGMAPSASRAKEAMAALETALSGRASGGKDGIILPNAMRHEVQLGCSAASCPRVRSQGARRADQARVLAALEPSLRRQSVTSQIQILKAT